jgi:PIN domain nuclease of toxin-antitoxin system
VTLLDAYALIALVADEPAAGEVEELLRGGGCRASVVNVAETVDVSHRVHALTIDEIREVLGPLFLEQLALVQPDERHAWVAAELRGRYYHRDDRPLSLADCFLLAHAGEDGAVATSDAPVAEVARSEGIAVVALPDSSGQRP